jgi:hypothetical protein
MVYPSEIRSVDRTVNPIARSLTMADAINNDPVSQETF